MSDSTTSVDGITSELLFVTPIFTRLWRDPELNGYLRELVLSRERTAPPATREYSNAGGWHSPVDLHESWDPDVRRVLERCHGLAVEATNRLLRPSEKDRPYQYVLSAWANVSREGDYNVPHVHIATWSAVYYVSVPPDCGNDPRAGGLELLDPRPPTAMIDMPGRFFATRHLIRPEPGLLVLFPASTMHLVHPFRGGGERISIACDLTIKLT
jgi:uncharacterized protein (TIGR02466 family)